MLQLLEQLGQAHRATGVNCCRCRRAWGCARHDGGAGKCQHLVQRGPIGDEIEIDELPSRRVEFVDAQVQPLRERGAAVVAQALRIGHREQEQVQRRGACIAAIDQMTLHEGLVNPAELLGHLAQPIGPQKLLDRSLLDCLHGGSH